MKKIISNLLIITITVILVVSCQKSYGPPIIKKGVVYEKNVFDHRYNSRYRSIIYVVLLKDGTEIRISSYDYVNIEVNDSLSYQYVDTYSNIEPNAKITKIYK